MSDSLADTKRAELSNPYASPVAEEVVVAKAAPVPVLPRTAEIWFAAIMVWVGAGVLAIVAGYIVLAWVGHTYPRLGIELARAAQLAQFATGAANAIVIAGLVSYGQYHAVIRRDPIWSRSIALLLMISSLVVGLGSVLIFSGSLTMWLLLVPVALGLLLSLMMFRWYNALFAFRRQQRRNQRHAAKSTSGS